jgi:hypothetical protein
LGVSAFWHDKNCGNGWIESEFGSAWVLANIKLVAALGLMQVLGWRAGGSTIKLVAAWDIRRIFGVPTFEGAMATVEGAWQYNNVLVIKQNCFL